MKNLITACACILILSIYILQFAALEATYSKTIFAEKTCFEYLDIAKIYGTLTEGDQKKLVETLALGLDVKEDEIYVNFPEMKISRGGRIEYEISYPIYGLIGAPGIFNLSTNENKGIKTVSGFIVSEGILD